MADSVVHSMTSKTTPIATDEFYIVQSPFGEGDDRRLTFENLEAALTLGNLGGATATGSGNIVRATSPTLVTPALGTPSVLVGTNITGTAAGLTAGAATILATARTINGTSFNGSANITVAAAAGTLTGTALAANVVTSSLTTLGTVTAGVWNGTAIPVAYGGTGATATTGSGANVLGTAPTLTSPVLVTPNLGTPSTLTLTNATGLPASGLSATGTRNATTFLRGDNTWAVPPGDEDSGVGLTSTVVSDNAIATVNTIHIMNGGELVTLALPAVSAVGDIIKIIGYGLGGYQVTAETGDTIIFGDITAAGGSVYINSDHRYNCMELVCAEANTAWVVASSHGTFTIE